MEAEAALSPLDLPPDGPLDHTLRPRPKLTAEIAASNFVCWAQALDLMGTYSRRSIYALYCEFSDVDNRTPLRDTHLLEALSQTKGIRREQLHAGGRGNTPGPYQWIIEPATKIGVLETSEPEIQEPNAPTVSIRSEAPQSTSQPTPSPQSQTVPTPTPARAILSRLLFDDDHPFSPAKLREQEKSARRARFISAASRKQRGALGERPKRFAGLRPTPVTVCFSDADPDVLPPVRVGCCVRFGCTSWPVAPASSVQASRRARHPTTGRES